MPSPPTIASSSKVPPVRLSISHTTRYDYAAPVSHGLLRLRKKPKSTHGQRVIAWDMALSGGVVEAAHDDHNGNATVLVSIEPGASALSITCSGVVETSDTAGVVGPHAGMVPLWCFTRPTALTRPGPRVRALAAGVPAGDRLEALHGLSRQVLGAVRYEIGQTDAATTAEDALAAGHGVCQDHAHIFIAAARLMGMPARYVSGYLMMDDRIDQEAGHAWAEAHVEGLGWVGFDVSNGISPDARYVRVATGCDYAEAAPVAGLVAGAGEAALQVRLAVALQLSEQ